MDQEKIGKFIAENRRKKKMTQEELASKLGVNSKSVSRWETGKCMPDLSLIIDLCKELDISINDFLSGSKVEKKDYNAKLEENIINVTSYSVKKTKKKMITKIMIGIVILILAWLTINTIDTAGFNFVNIDEYFLTKDINEKIINQDLDYFYDNMDYNYMYEVYVDYYGVIVDEESGKIVYNYDGIMSFNDYKKDINQQLEETLEKIKVNELENIDGYGSIIDNGSQRVHVQYGINPDDIILYAFADNRIEIRFSYTTLVSENNYYGYNYMPTIYLKN